MRAALCLAAAVLFAAGCSEKKSLSFEEKTTRVHISKLQKMVFRHKIPLQGTVMPVEFATISAKISGTVEMLKVDEGDKVKKGDLLCGIDRQVLRNRVVVCEDDVKIREAALESAKLAYRTAEITLSQARRDYERAKQLNEHKAISISAFDDAEADFKRAEVGVLSARAAIINAESQLKQAHSNLAIAKKNLTDSLITAPFDCVVADKFVEGNEFVAVGQDIFRLENHDSLEVICYISAVYFDRIQPGKTAVEIAGSQGICRSVISYKAPGIDPESRTFKIKALVPKESALVSGMLCELNIILSEKEGYGLPESAVLLRAENRTIAYTVTPENRALSVDIQRGVIDSGFCEVVNYQELLDEKFVITGQTFINNGSLLVNAGENK